LWRRIFEITISFEIVAREALLVSSPVLALEGELTFCVLAGSNLPNLFRMNDIWVEVLRSQTEYRQYFKNQDPSRHDE